jgi:hypothetical protein
MKRTLWFLLLTASAVTFPAANSLFGQAVPQTKHPRGYYTVIPPRSVSINAGRI